MQARLFPLALCLLISIVSKGQSETQKTADRQREQRIKDQDAQNKRERDEAVKAAERNKPLNNTRNSTKQGELAMYPNRGMGFYIEGSASNSQVIGFRLYFKGSGSGFNFNGSIAFVVVAVNNNTTRNWDIYSINTSKQRDVFYAGVYVKSLSKNDYAAYIESDGQEGEYSAMERYLSGVKSSAEITNDLNRVELENARKKLMADVATNIIRAPDRSSVEFMKIENLSRNVYSRGNKMNMWTPDSVFILHEAVTKSTWQVYLTKPWTNSPIGNLFMSFTESELKPASLATKTWEITDYVKEAEKKLNKILGKKSYEEMMAYYRKIENERKEKETAEIKKKEQDKLAQINSYKAGRKKFGSILKTAPFHSIVPYYRGDWDAYGGYDLGYEGYKLAVRAKDSIFILSTFSHYVEIILVEQKNKPGNDDGVLFGKGIYLKDIVPTGKNQNILFTQEDFIREIEKKIYTLLNKPVPVELNKPDDQYKIANSLPMDLYTNFYKWYESDAIKSYILYNENWPNDYNYHFGNEKRLNKFKKEYYKKEKLDFIPRDTLNKYLGDFIGTGQKRGLGVFRQYDSGYVFRGKYSYEGQRLDGLRTNKDGSVTLISFSERFTLKNDGTIIIEPDVIWKGQKGIIISPDKQIQYYERDVNKKDLKYYPFPETSILRTGNSLEVAEKFTNGVANGNYRFILKNNGDIIIYRPFLNYVELVKNNGDAYIGNTQNDKITCMNGLYISKDGYIYEGTMIDGVMDLYGQYLDETKKENYIGPYKDGKRHGFGMIFTVDPNNNEKMKVKYVVYKDGVLQ